MDLQSGATPVGSCLLSLPSCVLSLIINQLEPHDQGSLRLVAAAVKEQTDKVLESVQASRVDIEKLTALVKNLKALKQLTVSATGSSCKYKCYAELRSHVPDLVTVLSAHTSLKSIILSSEAAQQLGALKWARMESQQAVSESGPISPGPQPSPLDSFYWVPDWLAAAPKVQQLMIEAPDSSLSNRTSTQPVWLWLHPKAWANKLTCLQLQGVPLLSGTASLAIQGLTQLQRLCLTGTHLRPTAVEHLLRQLSSCEHLTALVLSGNDMCLLPELGWEGVTGLKELDVSRQMLLELPVGLSQLTGLTALQVHHNSLTTLSRDLACLSDLVHLSASHNWLSGAGPWLPHLLEAWPCLAVLKLDNVSDKRGELVLPPQLAGCRHMRELSIRDNFSINWTSLLVVLPNCKAMKHLRLDKQMPGDCLKDLQAVLRPEVLISLG